jgi:hypothetical protein
MPSPRYERPRRRRDRRVIPSAAKDQQLLSDLREVNLAVDLELHLALQHDDQLVRRVAITPNVATGQESMVGKSGCFPRPAGSILEELLGRPAFVFWEIV